MCALGKPRALFPDYCWTTLLEVVWGLCLLFWCARDNKRSPEGEVGLLASVSTWEDMMDFHGRLLVPDTERAAPA